MMEPVDNCDGLSALLKPEVAVGGNAMTDRDR